MMVRNCQPQQAQFLQQLFLLNTPESRHCGGMKGGKAWCLWSAIIRQWQNEMLLQVSLGLSHLLHRHKESFIPQGHVRLTKFASVHWVCAMCWFVGVKVRKFQVKNRERKTSNRDKMV